MRRDGERETKDERRLEVVKEEIIEKGSCEEGRTSEAGIYGGERLWRREVLE